MNLKTKKILTILAVLIAIVLIWRGIWGLADIYLFPSDPTISLVASILVGLIILAIVGKKFIKAIV